MGVAVVTGPSSGIGKATAIALAGLGYHVVAAGRSESRVFPVVDHIRETGGSAETLLVDLSSLDSARDAARALESSGKTIDVLVNNAGVGATRGRSSDGFEIHFAVNHLGHFMFTHHLRRTFRSGTRIVQVSSEVHRRAEGIDFRRAQQRTLSPFGLREYAISKLANILFVKEMSLQQPDWRLYAVHPGLTDTNIIPAYVRPFLRHRLLSPEQGADTVVWCATSGEVSDESGLYYAERRGLTPSPAAQDTELAHRLWKQSEIWCGVAPLH